MCSMGGIDAKSRKRSTIYSANIPYVSYYDHLGRKIVFLDYYHGKEELNALSVVVIVHRFL